MMIRFVLLVQLLLLYRVTVLGDTTDEDTLYTNSWAVQIDGDDELAERLATSHGFVNKGQVRRQ